MKKALIVGAGLAGLTAATKLLESGRFGEIAVVDSRAQSGGNCLDSDWGTSNYSHQYGPHAFHTNRRDIWDFVNNIVTFDPYFHKVKAHLHGNWYPLPLNRKSKEIMESLEIPNPTEFEYGESKTLGQLNSIERSYIFDLVFKGYTEKQWGTTDVDPSTLNRVKAFRDSNDDRYFEDRYQGLPSQGYANFFHKWEEQLSSYIGVNFSYGYTADGEMAEGDWDLIVYTGDVGELMGVKLPYRSARFETRYDRMGFHKEHTNVQLNFPNEFDFTRITLEGNWYKGKFNGDGLVTYEYPIEHTFDTIPMYPIKSKENDAMYQSAVEKLRESYPNMILAGRLGLYKYMNMDETIASTMDIIESYLNEC